MAEIRSLSTFEKTRIVLLRAVVNGLLSLTTRRTVRGQELIPQSGGCLLIFNHLSNLDPPLIFGCIDRFDLTALVAAEYRGNGFHRRAIEWAGGGWIRRGESDRAALKEAIASLRAGWIVGIAPEGGRSRHGAMRQAKPGAAFLAEHAGVPILPVAVTGTETVSHSLKRLRRAHITVEFGEPFALPDRTASDHKSHLIACSDEMMSQIGAMLPPEYRGHYADHPRLAELVALRQFASPESSPDVRKGVVHVPARSA